MFTGLIETTGTLTAACDRGTGRALSIRAPDVAPHLRPGDSIAVDGCCLTVEAHTHDSFQTFASPETRSRTTLGRRPPGARVNIERPVAVGTPLGGHLVTGHVDAMGVIARLEPQGDGWLLEVLFPPELAPFIVEKGSVAVDGISLTCFAVTRDRFRVAVIPETHRRTTLGDRRPGDAVNLEADLIGKYVARQLALRQPGGVSEDLLRRAGFIAGEGAGTA